jgi:hypothetical protein
VEVAPLFGGAATGKSPSTDNDNKGEFGRPPSEEWELFLIIPLHTRSKFVIFTIGPQSAFAQYLKVQSSLEKYISSTFRVIQGLAALARTLKTPKSLNTGLPEEGSMDFLDGDPIFHGRKSCSFIPMGLFTWLFIRRSESSPSHTKREFGMLMQAECRVVDHTPPSHLPHLYIKTISRHHRNQ